MKHSSTVAQSTHTIVRPHLVERYAAAAAFFLPLLLYIKTMAKGLIWGDGIELAAVASTLGIAHPTGYSLFTMLGHAFTWIPVGSEYWRVTLLCASCVAGSSVALYFLIRAVGDRIWGEVFPESHSRALLALGGALTFAVSNAPWNHATFTEVYALEMLLQLSIAALALRVLRTRSMKAFGVVCFLFGLGMTHHMLTVTVFPFVAAAILGLVIRKKTESVVDASSSVDTEKKDLTEHQGNIDTKASREESEANADQGRYCFLWRPLVPALLCFLIGLSPLLYLPIRASQSPPLNWGNPASVEQFIWTVTGGEFREFRFLMQQPGVPFTFATYWEFFFDRVQQVAYFLSGQLFAPSEGENPLWIVLILGGAVSLGFGFLRFWQQSCGFTFALIATVGIYLFFLFTYNIPDIRDYELGLFALLWPVFWVGFVELPRWGAIEWRRVGENARARRLAVFLFVIPLAAMLFNYRSADRSGIDIADQYATGLLTYLPQDSLLLTSGDNDIYSAWYLQEVEGFRTDVLVYGANFIFSPWYDAYFEGRDLRGRQVATTPGKPTTDVAFVREVSRRVIEPNLDRVAVFTTLDIPALRAAYTLEPFVQMITPPEYEMAVKRGEYPPPPYLFRISERREGSGPRR